MCCGLRFCDSISILSLIICKERERWGEKVINWGSETIITKIRLVYLQEISILDRLIFLLWISKQGRYFFFRLETVGYNEPSCLRGDILLPVQVVHSACVCSSPYTNISSMISKVLNTLKSGKIKELEMINKLAASFQEDFLSSCGRS